MLSSFDWIRQSRTGAELLATLRCLVAEREQEAKGEALEADGAEQSSPDSMSSIGPPHSALNSPCQRCWVYPRTPSTDQRDYLHCEFCKEVLRRSQGLGRVSRQSIVIWGFANHLPNQFQNIQGLAGEEQKTEGREQDGKSPESYVLRSKSILGAYVDAGNHFLVMIYRRKLVAWIQELVLYNGADLKGLIQIFPTMGSGRKSSMGGILCRAIHHESNFPMNQLRVRFYSSPYQLLKPHVRDRRGLLTFEVSEFLNLLEMAKVFRALLRPEEQKILHELLAIDDHLEEQFYWGRFAGQLSQEAKDMLNAWKIRNWSENRIRLLYELTRYVFLPQFS